MKFRNEYWILSNMYPCEITMQINGKTYTFKCAESAFQAHKQLNMVESFVALDGFAAKKLSHSVKLRNDWHRVRVGIMREILTLKFAKPELMRMLCAIKEPIVEENNWGDKFWGVCDGVGDNVLGNLLMEIRDANSGSTITDTPFRVIIAGGRDFNNYDLMKDRLDFYLGDIMKTGRQIVVISGCANGADTLGERYANERNLSVAKYPADWDTHGKSAGYRRNELMAANADALVAFWDGKSRGTEHMIDYATKQNLMVKTVRY